MKDKTIKKPKIRVIKKNEAKQVKSCDKTAIDRS